MIWDTVFNKYSIQAKFQADILNKSVLSTYLLLYARAPKLSPISGVGEYISVYRIYYLPLSHFNWLYAILHTYTYPRMYNMLHKYLF